MDRNDFGYEEAKQRLLTKEFLEETISDLYRLVKKGREEFIEEYNGAMEQYEIMFG